MESSRRDLSAARGEYAQLAKDAREAERKADSIEKGTLAGAQVDLPPDGDLLEAKYIGGNAQLGLITLRARRDGLKQDLEAETALLATAVLMTAFHRELTAGRSKAAALQMAQAETRGQYPHPYFWAAFVLSGDPE